MEARDRAARRGRLHVRSRQPGVERKHGDLDGKSQRHGQKSPVLKIKGVAFCHEFGDVEAAARVAEGNECHQQQSGAGPRV